MVDSNLKSQNYFDAIFAFGSLSLSPVERDFGSTRVEESDYGLASSSLQINLHLL